jgi:hypothetical protein
MSENPLITGARWTWSSIKKWLVTAGIALSFLLLYSCVNSEYNDSVHKETQLSALFLDNQNELSAYITSFYEQAGVANMKSEKMDKFVTDAIRGRYDKSGGFDGSAFVSMIKEAYPDLKEFGIYDKILAHVKMGRELFKGRQTYLLDQIRTYKVWYKEGLLRGIVMQKFIPSNNLVARIGDKVYTGKDALNMMERIITDSTTKKAYESGTLDPLQMPK